MTIVDIAVAKNIGLKGFEKGKEKKKRINTSSIPSNRTKRKKSQRFIIQEALVKQETPKRARSVPASQDSDIASTPVQKIGTTKSRPVKSQRLTNSGGSGVLRRRNRP